MSMVLNLGSLIFGVLAWTMPIMAIKHYEKGYNISKYSIYSFTLCAFALVFQVFEIRNRVFIEDWSALMDTIGAISVVSVILVIVTIILNLISNVVNQSEEKVS